MKKNLLTHTLFFTMNKADNNITITFLVPIFYLKTSFPPRANVATGGIFSANQR